MARNPKAYIRISGSNFDFRCFLGNGPAVVTGGGAEFEGQRRPQSDAATLFTGNGLLTIDVPVLFDGWRQKRDIEPHVNQVLRLCRGVGRRPPPNFTARGPIPYSGGRFQMSLPEWGDGLRHDGTLVRQALTLKLIEYNDPSSVEFRKRGVASAKQEAALASVVLRQPMTLLEVAAKYTGSADNAAALGKLNGIKDLRKKLKVGTRIKLGTEANLSEAIEVR
jgi:hypothetical protein